MTLKELYNSIINNGLEAQLFGDVEIADITFDSKKVTSGTMFTCKGVAFKQEYLASAVEKGACAYMSEIKYDGVNLPCIIVKDIRKAMSIGAIAFYGEPAKAFNTVGVTGTKGKTTTTFFLNNIFNAYTKIKNSAITTVEVMLADEKRKSVLTTPEAYDLQKLLYDVKQKGSEFLSMEVSSQAMKIDRCYGMHFNVGIFLNIGDDHVSPKEHPDWNDYYHSKLKLFEQCDMAVVCMDDPRHDEIADYARKYCKQVFTYGSDPQSDYCITDIRKNGEYLDFDVKKPCGRTDSYTISMRGKFNVSNAVAALVTAEYFGVSNDAIKQGIFQTLVPGRMDFFYNKETDVYVVIDFAHNKISLEALFDYIKEEFPQRRVGTVFGSAGNKAFNRRKAMGEAIEKYADYTILTDADSNFEDTRSICEDILQYVDTKKPTCRIIVNREEAITTILKEAQPGDIIVSIDRGEETRRWWKGEAIECVSDVQLAQRYIDGTL